VYFWHNKSNHYLKTRVFYEKHAQVWLTWSVPEYVRQALLKLREEEERAETYYPNSKKVVIAVIEDTIIVKNHKVLANVTIYSILDFIE
jgi:acid phosphatase class B